jgi:hypothetical protein
MNVTIEQAMPTVMGKSLSLRLDVFNFLNLINHDWGKIKLPSNSPNFNDQSLVSVVGQTQDTLANDVLKRSRSSTSCLRTRFGGPRP